MKTHNKLKNSTQVLKAVARSKSSLDNTAKYVVIYRQGRQSIPTEQATVIQKAATLKALRREQMNTWVWTTSVLCQKDPR